MLDLRPRTHRDAGERVRELRAHPGPEVVLDDRRPGLRFRDHQDERVARQVGLSRDREHQLDRPFQADAAPDRDHCPVREKGAVEGGERVAVRAPGRA